MPEHVSSHRVLLTFDDGPHPENTVAVLDELSRRGLSAVFFVLGKQLETPGARAVLERIAHEGHFIGNHGYSHRNLMHLADEEIRSSFRRTEALINGLDRGVKLWRPPFGEEDARVDSILTSLGYTRMLWNTNSMDWREDLPAGAWIGYVLTGILARIEHGLGNTVCLFHDPLENTAARFGRFLDELAKIPGARVARYDPCHAEGVSLPGDRHPDRASLLDPCDAAGFELDGVRVLARPRRGTLYILNGSAGLMWDALSRGASESEAAHQLARDYGVSEDVIARDIRGAVRDWRASGLIGPKAPEMEDPGPWPRSGEAIAAPQAAGFEECREYRLLDFGFTIRYQTAAMRAGVHPRFTNLEAAAPAHEARAFEITAHGDGFALIEDGSAARFESLPALAYQLFFSVTRAAHRGMDLMACLHAALLSYGEGSLALVANNGSGKSTLAAALASAGMRVHSDDRLFLDFASGLPAATPNSIGLKRGSWAAVESRYPALLKLPSVQIDQDEVRFLAPPPPTERLLPPVTHIFFPRYDARAETRAHELTPVEALHRIAASDGWISSEGARLQAFLRWMERAHCYELPFSDLDAAVQRIGERLPA